MTRYITGRKVDKTDQKINKYLPPVKIIFNENNSLRTEPTTLYSLNINYNVVGKTLLLLFRFSSILFGQAR